MQTTWHVGTMPTVGPRPDRATRACRVEGSWGVARIMTESAVVIRAARLAWLDERLIEPCGLSRSARGGNVGMEASPRRSACAFHCPWACAIRAGDVPAVGMFVTRGRWSRGGVHGSGDWSLPPCGHADRAARAQHGHRGAHRPADPPRHPLGGCARSLVAPATVSLP